MADSNNISLFPFPHRSAQLRVLVGRLEQVKMAHLRFYGADFVFYCFQLLGAGCFGAAAATDFLPEPTEVNRLCLAFL